MSKKDPPLENPAVNLFAELLATTHKDKAAKAVAHEPNEHFERCIRNGTWHDGQKPLTPRPPEATLPGPVEVLRRLNLGTFP